MITEPRVIVGTGIVEAWSSATRVLLDSGDRFNLTVHITEPTALEESTVGRFCPSIVDPSISKSIYDVANTIFPSLSPYHTGPLPAFFDHYLRAYLRGQKRHSTTWGCYFLRLISFGSTQKNQLKSVVEALSGWGKRPRAAFVLHLSSSELDKPKPLGAPCLQYAQLLRNDESTISLLAVYRSHDYFQKALGNFVGLTRLLRFVCYHTGMEPGSLTCLSTYAGFQGKGNKARQLLEL
jgi:hypothetical protein